MVDLKSVDRHLEGVAAYIIYAIVENMRLLAPEKYEDLPGVMRSIQMEIQAELQVKTSGGQPGRILELSRITTADTADVGGKMANLGELRNVLHMTVPDGFAITARAYAEFMRQSDLWEEINCLVLGHSMAGYFAGDDRRRAEDEDAEEQNSSLLELCAKIQNMILA